MAWLIEALDKRKHDREPRRAAEAGTGRTWVAIDSAADSSGRHSVLGYYTVSMYSVEAGALPAERRRGLPSSRVPAALLGRLAVDRHCQRQGLGKFLLLDALRRICAAADQVSAHAVVLDAIDEGAKRFYERFGFLELTDDSLHLFLPMASVRELAL